MIELIAILSNKDNYYRFKPFIKDYTLPRETRTIINDFDEYYKNNPSITDIDISKFSAWFLVLKHSSIKKEQAVIYQEIFKNVKAVMSAPTTTTAEDIVEHFVQRDYATRLADDALKIAEGDTSIDIIACETIIEDYRATSKRVNTDETKVENDFSKLYAPTTKGLNWRLDALNKSLGPLRTGDFIVVGKLPESGGTAFAISEMTHMLDQIEDDEVILYFGNEERGAAVQKRVNSAVLNRNTRHIEANPVSSASDFLSARGNLIEVHPIHGKSMMQIERIIKKYDKVALIVIDQLWKVTSYDKDKNEVSKITNLFVKGRELASKYAPVIAIHQAGGGAYENIYMTMDQLHMSRIGIQGEADAIITIGVDINDATKKNVRYINIPKNKLEGGPKSQEMYRHSKWEVKIIPEVSRYAD